MPRKRQETNRTKIARMLIEEYKPNTVKDIQDAIKDLLGDTLETMLKSELDEHLDYEYGDTPLSLNTRNGYSTKKVKSSAGKIELKIPRDRQGTFEPYVIKKYENAGFAGKGHALYDSRTKELKQIGTWTLFTKAGLSLLAFYGSGTTNKPVIDYLQSKINL